MSQSQLQSIQGGKMGSWVRFVASFKQAGASLQLEMFKFKGSRLEKNDVFPPGAQNH